MSNKNVNIKNNANLHLINFFVFIAFKFNISIFFSFFSSNIFISVKAKYSVNKDKILDIIDEYII